MQVCNTPSVRCVHHHPPPCFTQAFQGPRLLHSPPPSLWACAIIIVFFFFFFFFFKILSLYFQRGWKGGRKGGRETSVCESGTLSSCLSHTPDQGPGLQPRHVPWQRTEPAAFRLVGRHHRATVRAGLRLHKPKALVPDPQATPGRPLNPAVLCSQPDGERGGTDHPPKGGCEPLVTEGSLSGSDPAPLLCTPSQLALPQAVCSLHATCCADPRAPELAQVQSTESRVGAEEGVLSLLSQP